ncbi:hypothetical protein JT05_08260 [Desulfosporosinus sp. Tol-M]|nr:hypothetical protein JT05_08260 [Desulfosporosinus sp. Tol-M]
MATKELSQVNLDSYLDKLYENLQRCGDKLNARILNTLKLKLERQEVAVACYGYVSSGKSRLLNVLIGEDNLLPVSPLSSSKNSVYIRPGKSLNIGIWPKYKPPTRVALPEREQFHALCQDPKLECLKLFWATPEGLSLIDTPGIDSIESGHEQAANPLLLLADVVIYVTDYNHVESQVNFSFLKTLQAREIPYVLIVNQIDKHVDLELSLADFYTKLTQGLKQWDLKPLRVYFTSLTEDKSPACQLEQLEKMLTALRSGGAKLVISTVIRSVRQVLQRHSSFFSEQQEVLREPHLWVREQAINEQEVLFAFQDLEKQIRMLTALAETIDSEIMTEVNQLLENARLFSYETRELAKHVLSSRQPGFKAGFFASSAKTKSEQEQRLNKLFTELATRSEANITWHLRKILAEIPARYDLPAESYVDQVSQMNVSFEPELLLQTIRPGAMVSGEYVMNYTNDLDVALKSVYRQSGKKWIERAQEAANQKTHRELPSLQEQLEDHRRMLGSLAELNRLDVLHNNHMAELLTFWEQASSQFTEDRLWTDDKLPDSNRDQALKASRQQADRQKGYMGLRGNINSSQSEFPGLKNKTSAATVRRGHPKLWETVQDLTICSDLVAPLPGFSLRVKSLRQRIARLENNLFTVALFGAFSAGKSSLANALLGDSVLPVSPNPTTATINKILPPTDRYPHGTTKVKLKSLPDLTTDVLSSLAVFGLTATDLTQALRQIPGLDTQDVPLEAKPYLSFLKAVARDQSSLLEHLGEELTVDFLDFRDFVVSEDRACFVEGIELYFSCPLTELGVVLVDTPGSNSTNVRHTNIAFDYIKNADAVLFVTYYNNPFCKADAQFLSQLGKVKDTFEMDKLFFIVNASDLAQTPEELTLVLKHVEQNLRTSDIIRPRLFPVSSQLALLVKLAAEGNLQPEEEQLYRRRLKLSPQESLPEPEKALFASGLKLFETSFYTFIEEELINLAVESANKEIQRILQSVNGLLEAAQSDASQKARKLQGYRNLEQTILSGLEQISLLAEESYIAQEIDELIYYVNQRLSYRYSGLFDRDFFILKKPKEEQPKLAVQQCIGDFLQDIEVELVQEIHATSLRMERFVQKTLDLVLNKYAAFVSQSDQQCSLPNEHKIPSQEEPGTPVLNWDTNSLSKTADLYKNPKDWVEGQGRAKMLDTIMQLIQPKIKAWLNECSNTHKEFWQELFELECQKLREQAFLEVSGYYSRLATALADGYDVNYLEQVQTELAGLANIKKV